MLSWLGPPDLDQEERERRARLVLRLIRVMLVLGCIGFASALLETKNSLVTTLGFYGAVLGWLLFVRFLLKRGNVVPAAWILSIFYWSLVAFVTLYFGGMKGQYAATFTVTVLLIGAIVSGRAALALSIASSLWCAFVVWLETTNRLPPQMGPYSPINAWGCVTVTLLMTSVLLKNSMESLERMHRRAQASALERDEALRRSIQSQKMELVGNLTSGIAHDFNNLLTVMGSASYSLRNEIRDSSPEVRAWLDDLDGATSRAGLLTRQLLSFGRAHATGEAVFDLSVVLGDLSRMLPRLLGPNIDFVVETEANAHVFASRAGLEQILLNLAVNARDAMPRGGTLRIQVRVADEDVILTSDDTGVGMDEATRERIFEPFFTTKATGTGLGLATVRDLVTTFGGTIRVWSTPGFGSTFEVRFPRLADVPETNRLLSERPPVRSTGQKRILLVEDDPLVRRGVARSLEGEGYEVIATADGEEALALLQSADRIDCVVSDIAMPRLDGDRLSEEMARAWPELPLVLMSGNRTPARDAFPGTRRAFVEKPVDVRALVRLVEELS